MPIASLIMGIKDSVYNESGGLALPEPGSFQWQQRSALIFINQLRTGVFSPAITSTSFITGAGLKKCMPTTGLSRPAPISVMEREEVLVAKIHSGLQIACQLFEGLLFDFHVLDGSFNYQITVGADSLDSRV